MVSLAELDLLQAFNCEIQFPKSKHSNLQLSEFKFPYSDPSPKCGNFMIVLSLRFYVKSIPGFLEVQDLPY